MHAINANGAPVVIAAHPMPFAQDRYSNMRNDYAKRLILLGSLQFVFGGLSIIFEAVSLGIFYTCLIYTYTLSGYGICIGIMFIITGSLGIMSGKKRNTCSVVAFTVLSIISACVTAVLLILAIISAHLYNVYIWNGYYRDRETGPARVGIAMESLMVITAVAEAIVAIWSSVIGCKIEGCCNDSQSPPPTYAQHAQNVIAGQQPYGIANNGYNQQPQPQIMIAQQQMSHPMAYGQQPAYEQYSYDQQNTGYDNVKMN